MNNAHVIVRNGRKVGGQTITGSLLKHGQRMCVCVFLNFHKYLELAQFSIPIASFFAVDAIDDRAEDGFLRRRFRVHLYHDGNESGRKTRKQDKIRIANEDVNDAISSQSTSFQGEISKRPKNISDLASLISRHFVTQ